MEGDELKGDNVFHTKCLIQERACSMIIDGISICNIASTLLVKKLGLSTLKHLRPYKLPWFNDCGEVRVTKQVFVSFSIRRYMDKVLCDLIPIQTCHTLPLCKA